MSINLITDGWLYPIITKKTVTAPDGTEGVVGSIPTTPCSGTGTPSDAPPATPTCALATGPSIPTVPCGTTGNDPTITPPAVPQGQEGSETAGDEAPAIPGCPEGKVT